jgi:hypothetical protein
MMKKGDKILSNLAGKVYELKIVKDSVAMLEALDGSSKVWTEQGNLRLFYEKVQDKEPVKEF